MKKLLIPGLMAAVLLSASSAQAQRFEMGFDGGVDGWRTVLDGVMGGRSSGRVTAPAPGTLRFTGDLSLENNGGFSQIRTNVDGADFVGAEGVELVVRGDGRAYKFDVRLSSVRMMAGAYQQDFQTREGEWTTIRLPFDDFRLYSFGRLIANAPTITPADIESIGVTLADKQPGAFRLEIDAIRTYGAGVSPGAGDGHSDLGSVARGAGLNTILKLVEAAGLRLPDEPVTIFAPTDEAFAALPEDQVQALLEPEGLGALRAILSYHVVGSSVSSSELFTRRSLATLNGQRLGVGVDGAVSIGQATLVAADVPFDGGVVHVIDRVLMPELASITELASRTEALSTLTAAVEAAGLGDQLGAENGPWTVFAPVNSAFEALPAGALESLLRAGNRQELIAVLGLHVVPGRLYSQDLLATGRTQSFLGDAVGFDLGDGRLRVNGAGLVASDIEAGNGVVHLIDQVLLPTPREAERTSSLAANEAARLCELAINRGAPLFNAGQFAGCASVYELTIESMIALGRESLGRAVVQRLELGLAEASGERDWDDKAWAYRRALDESYAMLARTPG